MERKLFYGLIKKALRKFECLALKNEIDVTDVWLCYLFVSRTKAWLYFEDQANFILARHSNFVAFFMKP